MYVRFETRDVCPYARRGIGIFQTYGDIKYAAPLQDTWQLQELKRQLEWFGEHLNVPDRLFYRLNAKAERSGVCWFKDSAKTYISRARYFAWLLTDLGVHVSILRSRNPGRILWEDTAQVVAIKDM